MRQRGMVTPAVFPFRWFIFMDAQDLQDFECKGFLDSGFRRNDGVVRE